MDLKRAAGERAAEFVSDRMNIGLGTGSTVYWTIRQIGVRIRDGLTIRAVPTSKATAKLANEWKIPLVSLGDVSELDLTIDGADEINPSFDLIKGGGGALLREKLVAAASKRLIIVADESKMVETLGVFPLPVEVVRFGWETTAQRLRNAGFSPNLRKKKSGIFVTDNKNYILDCDCEKISDPVTTHREIKLITGVIETGIFPAMAQTIVVAGKNGVKIIDNNSL